MTATSQKQGSIQREQLFYDSHWQSAADALTLRERLRIEATVAEIPRGSSRILEVGCGDGRVSRAISSRLGCFVVGLDLSTVALSGLSMPKCCASGEQLPFGDRSFDLVVAAEMLEHLPEEVYGNVLRELTRVSSKHILITVPNRENLKEATVVCGACGKSFHKWGHLRRYTPLVLQSLLPGFRLLRVSPVGDQVPRYNPLLIWLRHHVARSWFWDEDAVCYYCHESKQPRPRFPLLARLTDALNARFWGPLFSRHAWLLALYTRE